MRALIPDRPESRALDGLPSEVELGFYGRDGPPAPDMLAGVEFAVLDPPPPKGMLKALGDAGDLQVGQSLSAGVGFLVGPLPDGVTLCDAAGVHDASVAEWVAAVLLADAKRLPF